jgi:acyl-coenzyme A thioesterase PaaI-like protein
LARSPSPGARIVALWKRLEGLPGGRWAFSRILGRLIPYTGTLGCRVELLEAGRARVVLRDRRQVRNHLTSVHAVALTNLGELTCGLALTAALPPSVRGIPVALESDFLKKARGVVVAECRCEAPAVTDPLEHTVVAGIRDSEGDEVAVVRVRWRLAPIPPVLDGA